jgi:hypothetical protein
MDHSSIVRFKMNGILPSFASDREHQRAFALQKRHP